jgi:hypothetical protein
VYRVVAFIQPDWRGPAPLQVPTPIAMDWSGWFKHLHRKSLSDEAGTALTSHAQSPYLGGIQPFQRWESFAEAVAVDVYGYDYKMGRGDVLNLPNLHALLKRLEDILNGWILWCADFCSWPRWRLF